MIFISSPLWSPTVVRIRCKCDLKGSWSETCQPSQNSVHWVPSFLDIALHWNFISSYSLSMCLALSCQWAFPLPSRHLEYDFLPLYLAHLHFFQVSPKVLLPPGYITWPLQRCQVLFSFHLTQHPSDWVAIAVAIVCLSYYMLAHPEQRCCQFLAAAEDSHQWIVSGMQT
jgi:hypothetical protein